MANSAINNKYDKKTGIGFKLLMLYLVFGTDSLIFSYNANTLFPQLSEYFMVALSLCMLGYALFVRQTANAKRTFAVFAICVWMVFLGIYHGEFSGGYISKICLFLLGFSLFSTIDSQKFVIEYCNTMRLICVVSLIGLVLSPVITRISLIPTITNTAGNNFKFLLFTNISTLTPFRNYGPFSEPSRYQAYINLNLIFLLFNKDLGKNRIRNIVIAVVALLTTFSTTGYIAFALITIAFVLKRDTFINGWKKYSTLAVAALFLVFLFGFSENYSSAITKLFMGTESTSFTVRFNSIVADLIIMSKHLFFGTGIQKNEEIFMNTVGTFSSNTEYTNTNTVLLTFAKFGIAIGGYYSWNLAKTTRTIVRGLSFVFLFLAFVAMLSGISFLDSIIFNIIIFYNINRRFKPAFFQQHEHGGQML